VVQTLQLRLSVAAELAQDQQSPGLQLQRVHVPALAVQLGAAAWNAELGRPRTPDAAGSVSGADAVQQERQQLLLLLVKAVELTTSNAQCMAAAPGLRVCVDSITGWVSTTRLALLMSLQQQVAQQLPALGAAAAMAGPGPGAAGEAAGRDEAVSWAPQGPPGLHTSSAVSSRRRSVDGPHTAAPAALGVTVGVRKLAVLVSSDEPEPAALHAQHHRVAAVGTGSCSSSMPGSGQQQQAGNAPSHASAPAGSAASLATCSTPLLEVVLLPLEVTLLHKAGAHHAGGSSSSSSSSSRLGGGPELRVSVSATLHVDVYSVDKLGWEPLLDPWRFQVCWRTWLACRRWHRAWPSNTRLLRLHTWPHCRWGCRCCRRRRSSLQGLQPAAWQRASAAAACLT
jgi:hypothetical protein